MEREPKPIIWIHTNEHYLLAAKVCAYSIVSRSAAPERFEVRLLTVDDAPDLAKRDGQTFRWFGRTLRWHRDQFHSFIPLRRMVPQLMGYRGRALVLDPDVFAVGDVNELLDRNLDGKAILCRRRPELHDGKPAYFTAVMLLDCAGLAHWQWDRDIDALFGGSVDFGPWITLGDEMPETVGELEEEWNHLDTLTERTQLLHNTDLLTQPWRRGLPVSGRGPQRAWGRLVAVLRRRLRSGTGPSICRAHPDPRQERYFFSLLAECLERGEITEDFVRTAMARGQVRRDALDIVEAYGRVRDPRSTSPPSAV